MQNPHLASAAAHSRKCLHVCSCLVCLLHLTVARNTDNDLPGHLTQPPAPSIDLGRSFPPLVAEAHEHAENTVKPEAAGFGYTDIIEAAQGAEGLTYRPQMVEARAYEVLLLAVHATLRDQARDIVRKCCRYRVGDTQK